MNTNQKSFSEKVKRIIRISENKPHLPESFIPWNIEPGTYAMMPETLLSLQRDPLFDSLTKEQQSALAKAEIAQVMYSYAWSEGLACLFFFRYLVSLKDNTSPEYRYLLIEVIEECRHQKMFSMVIEKLNAQPLPPRLLHRLVASFSVKFLPADMMFMSVLAIELVTDVYGTLLRKEENIYPVLAKISELHNIEEGRHIYFAELLLESYIEKAGIFKRTLYSIIVCLNIYFMRTMYVRKEIFRRIGVDVQKYYPAAYKGLKQNFADHCLKRAQDFVSSFGGFNWFSKLFWKYILGAKF